MNTEHQHLVIGAGPVGLGMAKAMGEHGIDYVQVEATDHVGGNWAHGVYDTAHIISSRKTTEYSDYAMPASYPDFPSAKQMCAYFEDYAAQFGLLERIRFETKVVSVTPEAGAWRVTYADGAADLFKGVVVCNGHHWKRRFPPWVEAYEGEVIHSKDYKTPDDLRHKRVLVLGGGNSGCDIISEAARVSSMAHWSLRRGYWFMPKTLLGRPSIEFIKPWIPVFVQRWVLRALLRVVVGRYRDYGLPTPDHRIFEAHPSVSTEVFHYLKHGRITPRPNVVAVHGDTIEFSDGRRDRYDLVVCATGYDVAFPFLPEGFVPIKDKCAQLVAGMLLPEHRGLYLVGTYQPRYGLGPLVRPGAELLADWIQIQDEIEVPLGAVLARMGVKAPQSHLMDPHKAMRQLRLARRLPAVIKRTARRMTA
jgi:hypothetical protein